MKTTRSALRGLLDGPDFTQSKTFLRSFVKKLIINGDKAKIHYRLPMLTDGDSVQPIGVLPIDPLGGPDRTFAKQVESFFELSIIAAPSFHEGRGNGPK